jgi:hypothetical protein
MLSYDEFEALCNRMDAELAAEKARQESFMNALEKAIIEISFQHFPETEQHKHQFILAISQKAHQRAVSLNEILDFMMGGYPRDDYEYEFIYQIPERDVSLEEKQFLEETLKNMPPEQHDFFIQLNTERLEIEAEEREFVFSCYDKAKELIVQFFPEMINLSGSAIRYLDSTAYLEMDEWTYDFYYFAGEYMNNP